MYLGKYVVSYYLVKVNLYISLCFIISYCISLMGLEWCFECVNECNQISERHINSLIEKSF